MPSPSKSFPTLCLCLMLLSATAWADSGKANGVGGSGGNGGGSSSSTSSSSSSSCACSDVRPRSGGLEFELGPTCDEVVLKSQCDAPWLKTTIAEMKGRPYCEISCERCRCCEALDAKLRSLGLAQLADALAAAGPAVASALKSPATSVTLLAPVAFEGGASIDSATAMRHIVPAANGTGALWTRELILGASGAAGAGIPTLLSPNSPLLVKGATLSTGGGGGGKAATFVEGKTNIEACKSLIHLIDGVL